MRVLNADQMREADRRTIEEIGVPSVVLMENAGRQVVAAMGRTFGDLEGKTVSLLCGPGNNGGDGFVAARVLHQQRAHVKIFLVGHDTQVRGDARVNLNVLNAMGLPVVEVADGEDWERVRGAALGSDLIVDALFGTGLKSPLAGLHEAIVTDVNTSRPPVVAVDVPSGLACDSPALIGSAIRAALTVTFAAPKLPHVLAPASHLCGTVVVADIGMPREVIASLSGQMIETIDRETVQRRLPERQADAHKGTFGHVLIVAGSRGKSGAAHLAAMGALRSGAGLATVATPAAVLPIVAALGSEYMTLPLPETSDGALSQEAVRRVLEFPADVVAVGPGIGTGQPQQAFVESLLDSVRVPLVLDADALNVLARCPERLRAHPGQIVIVTPHPGEMARLLGSTTAEVQQYRVDVARSMATSRSVYIILKGYQTVVATPGGAVFVNTTGNPGMATGGSGDVLTGMVAAWLAQLHDAEAACLVAVYLHGAAGDAAAERESAVAMTARDILANLGSAIRRTSSGQQAG